MSFWNLSVNEFVFLFLTISCNSNMFWCILMFFRDLWYQKLFKQLARKLQRWIPYIWYRNEMCCMNWIFWKLLFVNLRSAFLWGHCNISRFNHGNSILVAALRWVLEPQQSRVQSKTWMQLKQDDLVNKYH